MSEAPFMPLWVGDFLSKTSDLDARETGAYLLILMAMWTRGGRLPDDQKKLQRVARVGRDWPQVWGAICHYFTTENGFIHNSRVTEELAKVRAKSEVRSNAGARGGRAKALKEKERGLANATILPQQSYSYSESEKKEYINGSAPQPFEPPPDDEIDKAFARFWQVYPLRSGQVKAQAAFILAAATTPVETIIAGAQNYAAARKGEDPKYTTLPVNWLTERRWTDEPQKAAEPAPDPRRARWEKLAGGLPT